MSQQENVAQTTLAERLRQRRKALSLTMRAAARQAGVDVSYWSRLEGGSSVAPSERVASDIATVLHCETEWLLHGTGNESVLHERQMEYIASDAPREGGCRIPAGCDLIGQLAEMKAALAQLQGQVQALTQLLGASLAPASASAAGNDRRQKAG